MSESLCVYTVVGPVISYCQLLGIPAIARGGIHLVLAVKTYIPGYLYDVRVCQGSEVEPVVIELKG